MSDDRPLPAVPGFRVLRLLGEGGMGVVYEAEQESPRRRVALKLVREADVDPDSFARLELEADALARLTHPGVVPLLASGRTDGGSPWLALELVDGVPLDRYVREERPSLRERVARFEELCAAVAHAHQRGVVHRDLKPSNVLVAPRGEGSGGGARVRVLDFGLARIVRDERPADDVDRTLPGRIVGTLAYASPEQARGDGAAVDQRSDVHALGALLYELLTDRRPIDVEGCWIGEAARRVATVEPTPPHRIARVPRDLSTIATKALAKEPLRRYASAAHLRDDVVRWQTGLPIAAVGPNPLYALRKLAARHKAWTAAAVTALLALLLAGPLFAWNARRQADEMRAARDRARSVLRFQEEILSAPDPTMDGRDVRLSEVLRRAGDALDRGLAEPEPNEAALRSLLGRAWLTVGDREEARRQLDRARELAEDDETRREVRRLLESLGERGE